MSKNRIIVIGGATASGKSGFALQLAKKWQPEQEAVIINADSMQVYREIPVITAQPSDDEQKQIEHKLYGFLPVKERCSVALWLDHVEAVIREAFERNILPIVVGGTGMYLRCLIEGVAVIPEIAQDIRQEAREKLNRIGHKNFHILLGEKDPLAAEKLSPRDTQRMLRAWEVLQQTSQSLYEWQQKPHRIPFEHSEFICAFLYPPRDILYQQCNARFLEMLNHGALEEVDALEAQGLDENMPAMKALGVPELVAFKRGEVTFDRAIELAQQHTRHFAKRQMTWFRNQFPDWPRYDKAEEGVQAVIAQLKEGA